MIPSSAVVRFACPSCGRKLRPVPTYTVATQVVRRRCKCGDRWNLVVTPLVVRDHVRVDRATISFVKPEHRKITTIE